jgi:hypothetical protein
MNDNQIQTNDESDEFFSSFGIGIKYLTWLILDILFFLGIYIFSGVNNFISFFDYFNKIPTIKNYLMVNLNFSDAIVLFLGAISFFYILGQVLKIKFDFFERFPYPESDSESDKIINSILNAAKILFLSPYGYTILLPFYLYILLFKGAPLEAGFLIVIQQPIQYFAFGFFRSYKNIPKYGHLVYFMSNKLTIFKIRNRELSISTDNLSIFVEILLVTIFLIIFVGFAYNFSLISIALLLIWFILVMAMFASLANLPNRTHTIHLTNSKKIENVFILKETKCGDLIILNDSDKIFKIMNHCISIVE